MKDYENAIKYFLESWASYKLIFDRMSISENEELTNMTNDIG